MTTHIVSSPTSKIAVVQHDGILISNAQDVLDLIATLRHEHDCDALVIPKACIAETFFDLKTGIAGEVLQKCTNYQMKIAIVGDFSVYTSNALKDFIFESNKGNSTYFLPTEAAAVAALQ